ncbi:hypothetical protein J6590_003458 [Homalodisca vitripennis]|nr:hypothetical protein J6590_003458 [Homalodisca vitripennis]
MRTNIPQTVTRKLIIHHRLNYKSSVYTNIVFSLHGELPPCHRVVSYAAIHHHNLSSSLANISHLMAKTSGRNSDNLIIAQSIPWGLLLRVNDTLAGHEANHASVMIVASGRWSLIIPVEFVYSSDYRPILDSGYCPLTFREQTTHPASSQTHVR